MVRRTTAIFYTLSIAWVMDGLARPGHLSLHATRDERSVTDAHYLPGVTKCKFLFKLGSRVVIRGYASHQSWPSPIRAQYDTIVSQCYPVLCSFVQGDRSGWEDITDCMYNQHFMPSHLPSSKCLHPLGATECAVRKVMVRTNLLTTLAAVRQPLRERCLLSASHS